MPTNCKIDFQDNPMKIVYAGELLRGTVRLTLTKEKCVRAVYIRLCGHASVRLDDPARGYSSNRQNYLNKAICLIRRNNGKIRLMPGTHKFEFQCVIPFDLPSSVEGSIGHIRYTASVIVDIPMWQSKEFHEQFAVIKTIDLNDYPMLREPVIVTKSKSFFLRGMMCGFSSKPINIVVRIPVRGYIPRQTIHLELFVNNRSGHSITEFRVQLIKQIKYLDRRKEFLPITEQIVNGCGAYQEQFLLANLSVPPVFPTDLSSWPDKIIEVEHLIRITGLIKGCYKNIVLNMPIVIGSYPFQEYRMASTTEQLFAPDIPPANLNDNPPTYAEALLLSGVNVMNQMSTFLPEKRI